MIARVAGATVAFRPAAIGIRAAQQPDDLVIRFDGAHATAPKGVGLERSQTNYLLGNNPALWRTHISNYGKVVYSGLYKGVDAIFYGNGSHLEHDFIVRPGADYRQIRMHFPDASRLTLEQDGTLTVRLAAGSLRMAAPSIYQNVSGKRQRRYGAFRVRADGDVGFTVDGYDQRFDLVIDPVLDFSTYLSPLGSDGLAIAADANGNSYVTGYGTWGYPVTSGAFAGCSVCTTGNTVTFVSKLSADGSQLIYSTVLGGNNFAQPTGLAVDANGDAIVTGWTAATDFPTKSGQAILPQNNNYVGFLLSLSADGSSLNYGTLLGSSPTATQNATTYATAVTVDSTGNAYVTGETGDGFFISSGALNQAVTGNSSYNNFEVFLAKFSPAGGLIYSAVLGTADPQNGGGGPIGAEAIAVDASGNAYVTGQAGTLWPITSGAYLNQIAGSMPYATPFVMKVAPDAKSVVYSTYLDYGYQVNGISVLSNGNVFVVGNGAGPSYPTTADAYEPNSGNGNSFLTELNASGSALVYSTMVCGGSCTVNGLAVGPDGNIWLAAQTSNAALPLKTPLQSILPSGISGLGPVSVVSEFDPSGKTLQFATFLGGMGTGYASSVAVDANLRVHVSGAAQYGMYTTPGVYAGSVPQPGAAFGGSTYAYVALIDPTLPAAGLCARPNTTLYLPSTPVGSSGESKLTITSCGAEALSITDASSSSSDFSVPAAENGCIQSLSPGQSCTLNVRFTPTAGGSETAMLTIASNAPIPAMLPLKGTGTTAAVVSLSANSLTFGPQVVGTESAPQTITLTNTGNGTLDGIGFGMYAQYEPIFPLTSACGPSLAPGQSCTFSVSFKPTATGTTSTTLLVENSSGVPFQQVSLTGTSSQSGFTIGAQTGGSMSSTVTAGSTASYALTVTPAGGYSGTVNLSCSNLPANAACTFSPASLAVNGSAMNVTLSVSTASTQTAALLRRGGFALALAGFIFLMPFKRNRKGLAVLICFAALLAVTGISGCGGGSSSSSTTTPPPSSSKVSPGTYTIQVIAADTSGNKTSQAITLIVQ